MCAFKLKPTDALISQIYFG